MRKKPAPRPSAQLKAVPIQLSRAEREYDEDPESAQRRASANLALLILWMQAEQSCDRGGRDSVLEQDAWYAAETILIEARDVLNCEAALGAPLPGQVQKEGNR